MTPLDDEKLTKMLREAAEECKRLGYRPTAFLKMLNADGGYATAVKLLASQKISDGFVELQMLGKLNLTVEALVLENGWAEDFEPDLIRQAQRRLVAAGYIPKMCLSSRLPVNLRVRVVAARRAVGGVPFSARGAALSKEMLYG